MKLRIAVLGQRSLAVTDVDAFATCHRPGFEARRPAGVILLAD
jgi:hypothetical protein